MTSFLTSAPLPIQIILGFVITWTLAAILIGLVWGAGNAVDYFLGKLRRKP